MRWFLSLLLCLSTTLWANQNSSIKKHIDNLIRAHDKHINIGIAIKDLTTGKTLYQKNATRYFTPASNMKLYTDAAALLYLGPDFRYQNSLYIDARQINNGTVKGNIYLSFSGDPSLNSARLSQLLANLKKINVRRISGDLILSSEIASAKPYGPGWMIEDTEYAYGAPVAPFIIDKNTVSFNIAPAMRVGGKAIIHFPDTHVEVNNEVQTKSNRTKSCYLKFRIDDTNRLLASGCIRNNRPSIDKTLAIKSSFLWAKLITQQQLKALGIGFDGQIRQGNLASTAKLIAWEESPPLSEIVNQTLKESDNAYADSLFLKLTQYLNKKPTWYQATQALKILLNKLTGLNLQKAVIVDGSGLSRYNLVTPQQTIELLAYLHTNFAINHEYISALPIGGRDGTLKRRLLGSHQVDRVRAKTGSMLGIISLAGYLSSKNQHTLAFSMMINGIPGRHSASLAKYRWLEDSICNYLTQTNIKDPVLNKKKLKPRPSLPYESYANFQIRQRKIKSAQRALERQLRFTLANWRVDIYHQQHRVIIDALKNTSSAPKTLDKYAKKISALLKNNPQWLLFESRDAQLLTLFKSSLPQNEAKQVLYVYNPKLKTHFRLQFSVSQAQLQATQASHVS